MVTAPIAVSGRRLVRRGRVDRQAPFAVLCADPPWQFGDRLPGAGRGAEKHYGCLSLADLERFPLPPIADDALLFLWRVAAMPQEALDVCGAWGFVPKSEIVWVKRTTTGKRHMGMGRYVRAEHETCVVASRGRGIDLIRSHSIRSVLEAPVGRHSAKPDEFFDLVRQLVDPSSRKAELFTRRPHPGFVAFGDQVEAMEPAA
ncbi:MAG TPA: MT-A70 family methyltransferase [Polyangiaceae bacterium]|nr:MT-A70 family methyltransferase [Polyangiaceae bacterium]